MNFLYYLGKVRQEIVSFEDNVVFGSTLINFININLNKKAGIEV